MYYMTIDAPKCDNLTMETDETSVSENSTSSR